MVDFKKALARKFCSVCAEPQFETPSGLTCKNGHGGVRSETHGAPEAELEPAHARADVRPLTMDSAAWTFVKNRKLTDVEDLQSAVKELVAEVEAQASAPRVEHAVNRMDRCTGGCCEDMALPISPDELAAGYRRWIDAVKMTSGFGEDDRGREPIWEDIHLIFLMLRYLGFYARDPNEAVNPESCSGLPPGHHYACKHFDPETRDCTIYEIRPTMCRDYPYLSTCDYASCTWLAKKTQRLSEKERERLVQIRRPIIDED